MKLNKLESKLKELSEQSVKLPMVYKKRRQVFENSSGTCCLDLINERGHSYEWWVMFQRINGVLVLNTYRYSSSTAKHISKAQTVLRKLNVKYISLEAPQGLQNLEAAKNHILTLKGEAEVEYKYARIKLKNTLHHASEQIKTLSKLGIEVTALEIDNAILQAEQERISKNARLRELRLSKKTKEQLFNSKLNKVINQSSVNF